MKYKTWEGLIVTLENSDFILVKHKLVLSMNDENVYNVISDKSAQKYYICGTGLKDINNLNVIKQRPFDLSNTFIWFNDQA